MTDKRLLPVPGGTRLPATAPPRPSLPTMPTGGGFAFTPTGQLRQDVRHLSLYGEKLRALADNAAAMRELVDKRDALALAIANLQSLPERCAHQYEMGRLSRHNELELARLDAEHGQLQAKVRNAQAMLLIAQYQPSPPTSEPVATPVPVAPAPPPVPSGLSPAEIDEMLAQMPELSKETRNAVSYLLNARLREKG